MHCIRQLHDDSLRVLPRVIFELMVAKQTFVVLVLKILTEGPHRALDLWTQKQRRARYCENVVNAFRYFQILFHKSKNLPSPIPRAGRISLRDFENLSVALAFWTGIDNFY